MTQKQMKCITKKTLTLTSHHYWGALCQGAFVLDPFARKPAVRITLKLQCNTVTKITDLYINTNIMFLFKILHFHKNGNLQNVYVDSTVTINTI